MYMIGFTDGEGTPLSGGSNYRLSLPANMRAQLLPLEAQRLESNTFGQYYEVRGTLTGPNGVALPVRTIWMTEHLSGVTKFVTLIPDQRRTE